MKGQVVKISTTKDNCVRVVVDVDISVASPDVLSLLNQMVTIKSVDDNG